MSGIILHGLAIPAAASLAEAHWQHIRTDAQLINGGRHASELCMLAVDAGARGPLPDCGVVQLKVDGVRALWIDGRIVSREGVPIDCAGHCAAALQRLEDHLGEPYFFDGEYVEDDGFNATLKAMRRGAGAGVIWLFDAVPLRLWRLNRCDLPIEHRLRRLQAALPHAGSSAIGALQHWICTPAAAEAKAAELIALGYEGAVIKAGASMYVRERCADWQRIKASVDLVGTVMDVMQRPDDRLKAMLVKTDDGQTMRVATGWSRERAAAIVALWHAGRIPRVHIRCNPIVGGGYRGVRYVGFTGEFEGSPS